MTGLALPEWCRVAPMAFVFVLGACSDNTPKRDAAVAAPTVAQSASPSAKAAASPATTGTGQPDTARASLGGALVATANAGTATKQKLTRRIEFGGMDFTGIGYDRGKADAPVVMIDLSDFACPYCGEFAHDVFPTIDKEYIQTGKVLFKYIPFVAGSFRHAGEATRAAECVADQGQFWPMMERLYITQAEWKSGNVADAQMAEVPLGEGRV